MGIEFVESTTIAFSLFQHQGPVQSCLRTRKYEPLEVLSVAMNGNAPLPIVIFEQQWIVFVDPGTPFTCPRRALHNRVLVGYENEISEGSIETIKGARTALSK